MILEGIPDTTEPDSTSLTTTEFGQMKLQSPILILPSILAPAPINTLFPIVGTPFPLTVPISTPGYNVTLSPMTALVLITIYPP